MKKGVLFICVNFSNPELGTAYRHRNSAMSVWPEWPRAAGSAITQPWLALGYRISRMTVWPRAVGSAITDSESWLALGRRTQECQSGLVPRDSEAPSRNHWLALGCRIFPLRDYLIHLPRVGHGHGILAELRVDLGDARSRTECAVRHQPLGVPNPELPPKFPPPISHTCQLRLRHLCMHHSQRVKDICALDAPALEHFELGISAGFPVAFWQLQLPVQLWLLERNPYLLLRWTARKTIFGQTTELLLVSDQPGL